MTRKDALKKFKQADLILVAFVDWGRSHAYNSQFPYFQIWTLKNKKLEKIVVEECPYWSKRKEAYAMSVWGTDRVFELIYSITRDLQLTNKLFTEFKVMRLW